MIQIAVEDQGQTIPREFRERVFEKFFRATRDGDTGDSIQPKGTGMGLRSLKESSKRMADISGSKIKVQGRDPSSVYPSDR